MFCVAFAASSLATGLSGLPVAALASKYSPPVAIVATRKEIEIPLNGILRWSHALRRSTYCIHLDWRQRLRHQSRS